MAFYRVGLSEPTFSCKKGSSLFCITIIVLTNEELQDIISNLSPEERKQLLFQLGRQVEVDNITNPTQSTNTKPKHKPKSDSSKVYCCPLCSSASYKKHGTTSSGMQRYICKDSLKTVYKTILQ